MSENRRTMSKCREDALQRKIASTEARKSTVKRWGVQGLWLGLGIFGLVGWAVAIPPFLGVLLGAYIDGHYPGVHSWTLSLLIVGLFIGCLNAWLWVARVETAIRDDEEARDE